MALNETARIALAIALFGSLAFIFGILAENKKPQNGTPIIGKDVVICQFPSDPSVALGSVSVIALFFSAIFGIFSVFYSYKGKSVPKDALFRSTFIVAMTVTLVGEGMMIWATVTEGLHRTNNVHHDLATKCPTAKTGLFECAAFLALDAAVLWLVCQMLTMNARADYLDEYEDDPKGQYREVLATDYEHNVAAAKV